MPARRVANRRTKSHSQKAEAYQHDAKAILRPEAGTQAQFRKKKPARTYRYDSSLSPALDWDGQNHARELGEWLLSQIQEAAGLDPPHRFAEPRRFGEVVVEGLADAVRELKAISGPFLNWAGKAERLSFQVPTLPLFVQERLSTKAIVETLKGHARDRQMEFQLFGDPHLSLAQQLEAYEHAGGWVNRLILGDSLVGMNSLLEYEGLGGQVQMIYIDPPYGVKFKSNFQPFVRRRDVKDGDDHHLTREPEMVKAYRDTWELGLHSYLTYLRDRLLLARELLNDSGSVFVQIGDENVHHVREILDEVFGSENFVSLVWFRKKTMPLGATTIEQMGDYLLWYARDAKKVRVRHLYLEQDVEQDFHWSWYELPDGSRHRMTAEESRDHSLLPKGARLFRLVSLWPPTFNERAVYAVRFENREWFPPAGQCWPSTNPESMSRLIAARRIQPEGKYLRYVLYYDDYKLKKLVATWNDTVGARDQTYVVQTAREVVQRCMLMTTDPGDLVLDPTCGSGTTAYVAEQWGRRWITVDVSRVPLALTRQRLLTATFHYYKLRDHDRGPAAGFVYERRQNAKGEEVGGIVPHVTLKSIANDEPPQEEVLVDRPEVDPKITRVTGAFSVEATIPTPLNGESADQGAEGGGSFAERLIEALRRDPVLHLPGGTIGLNNVQPPAKSLTLSAEATLESDGSPAALLFGPENGAVSEKAVFEAAKEANARSYSRLIVIGFAIEPGARELIEKSESLVGIPATYVAATPDLVMGDLLKTMRSSQLFSVTGLPDVTVRSLPPEEKGAASRYQVELRGLDVFDPATMQADHRDGSDVPAWLLDTDYNDLSFHVSQAFFPRTSAWDSLKRALRGEFEDSVWEHLAGTTSEPFTAGENRKVAVKVIDDRGNELMVVRPLD
ncbi:MAG: site-specific DNA-methyltransferase [Actinomycetota bacterium]